MSWVRLDSSAQDDTWRVDGFAPTEELRSPGVGRGAQLRRDGVVVQFWPDELDALRWLESAAADTRWVGYFAYDLGRAFEEIPRVATDDLDVPAFLFVRHNTKSAHHHPPHHPSQNPGNVRSTFTEPAYLQSVRRAIDYIAAGDIFQVNLSQRFSCPLTDDPFAIYERLTHSAPARYGGFLDFDDHALLCNSPELFLSVTPLPDGSRRITTRPIKGTRPRGQGMRDQLLHSEKDQAELNMIVDLERNDLGRVCQIGSVKVTQPRTIEQHPTLYHGVATVEGLLRADVSLVDLLRATFPGGSITGAPKIRAMQIIEELEPVRRGPYCGAIGSLGPRGHVQLNVAIRTMIIKDNTVHIPVGGGIVADSLPHAEYEETLVKAKAMFDAVGVRLPAP